MKLLKKQEIERYLMHSIKEQNQAGVITGICMLLALVLIILASICNTGAIEAETVNGISINDFKVVYR